MTVTVPNEHRYCQSSFRKGLYMIDISNVILIFQQMSGLDNEQINGELSLIQNAAWEIENVLAEEKLMTSDYPRCEYAAACTAFYDYICKRAAQEKIITTAEGKTVSNEDYSKRISSALKLKITALCRLDGIIKDTEFIFSTMEKAGETLGD